MSALACYNIGRLRQRTSLLVLAPLYDYILRGASDSTIYPFDSRKLPFSFHPGRILPLKTAALSSSFLIVIFQPADRFRHHGRRDGSAPGHRDSSGR